MLGLGISVILPVYFDYLMLDKEIIFIPYDRDNYFAHRKLYYEYDEVTPGIKYISFDEFINGLSGIADLDHSEERRKLKEKFFDDYDYDASEKTYKFLKERYGL